MKNIADMTPIERLVELVEDWKLFLRRDGIKSSLPRIMHEIIQLPYRHLKFHIIARSLADPLPNLHPKIDLEIQHFQGTDLEQVWAIDRPSVAKLCARRLVLGQKGLAAFHKRKLVGYAWGCSEMSPQLERLLIKLEPGDIFCTDVYTIPSFRGKGVQTALSLARFTMFRDLGFHRAICYIEVGNAPSLWVWQRKLGGYIVGSVDFVRVGPWYRVHCYGMEATEKLIHSERV